MRAHSGHRPSRRHRPRSPVPCRRAPTPWSSPPTPGISSAPRAHSTRVPDTAAGAVTVPANGSATVSIGTDVTGALGYNVFVASTGAGPFNYCRSDGVATATRSTPCPPTRRHRSLPVAADASAIATNFDGFLTNLAASGGYVKRLNSTLSTATPGMELQSLFSSVFDAVKGDPDTAWFNGHDRNQLSNALLAGNNVNNYGVRIVAPENANGVTIGCLVQGIVNQITGKEVAFNVHPWMPQGNVLVRSEPCPSPTPT